jgi:anti-anti-sigma regulatory factor
MMKFTYLGTQLERKTFKGGSTMFRIDRIYKDTQVELWKISGEIRPSHLKDWAEALKTLPLGSGSRILLDFCEVAYLSQQAAGYLIDHLTTDIFITNCPAPVKNMIYAAGLSSQLLG